MGPQGYLISDEPNESRFDMIVPALYTILAVLGAIFLREYANIDFNKRFSEVLLEADHIEAQIDKRLQAKADRIKALEAELGRQ